MSKERDANTKGKSSDEMIKNVLSKIKDKAKKNYVNRPRIKR